MRKFFVGGVSAAAVVTTTVISGVALVAVGAGGDAVAKKRRPHPVELVIPTDTLVPTLAPQPKDKINWVSSDGKTVNVKFAGPTNQWPCEETQDGSTVANPCTLSPAHDGDTYLYTCTIGSGAGAPVCADPDLGPISASSTLINFLKILNPAPATALPLKAGAALYSTQIYCDPPGGNAGVPVLYTLPDPNTKNEPIHLNLNDKIVWANATGAPLTVAIVHGFTCSEGSNGLATSGCTVATYSGTATYTIQGCPSNTATSETLVVP